MHFLPRYFIVLCFLFPGIAQAQDDIPEIGSVSLISLNKEKEIGRLWLQKNYRQLMPVTDFLLQSYLEHLVGLLAQGESLKNYDIQAYVLPGSSLNAFAVPGGILGFNLGVWRYAETEGEFASVVAHELAHLSQRHFARTLQDARKNSSISLASVLIGLGLIVSGNVPAGALAIYGSAGYQQDQYLALSRRFESEADNLAYFYMRQAGYQANDIVKMFNRMDRLSRHHGNGVPEYMLTHPLTSNRLNNARLRAQQQNEKLKISFTDYPFARLRALSFAGLPIMHIGKTPTQQQYAQALIMHAKNQHKQAAALMQKVAVAHPKSSFLFFSSIESLLRAGDETQALTLLRQRAEYAGNSVRTHYFLGRALAMKKNYASAIDSMLIVLADNQENEHIWGLLSEYYAQQNDKYRYFRADAVRHMLMGATARAQKSLDFARKHAKGDKVLLVELDDIAQKMGILAKNKKL